MYYLRCSQCNHANEVKNEFLTFCEACGAKIPQNFTIWKKMNPKGTLEQFQQTCCISHDQIIRESIPEKKSKGISRTWAIVLIVLLIFTGLGTIGYFVYPYAKDMVFSVLQENQDAIIAEIIKEDWHEQECGLGLSLSSPLPLQKSSIIDDQVPQELKDIMVSMDNYTMTNPLVNLVINAMSIQYAPSIVPSLEGGRDGAVQNMKNQPGVSNFDYESAEFALNGLPGYRVKGSYLVNGQQAGFQFIIFGEDLNFYQVIVIYDVSGHNGEKFANKVLESVKLEQ